MIDPQALIFVGASCAVIAIGVIGVFISSLFDRRYTPEMKLAKRLMRQLPENWKVDSWTTEKKPSNWQSRTYSVHIFKMNYEEYGLTIQIDSNSNNKNVSVFVNEIKIGEKPAKRFRKEIARFIEARAHIDHEAKAKAAAEAKRKKLEEVKKKEEIEVDEILKREFSKSAPPIPPKNRMVRKCEEKNLPQEVKQRS